MILVHGETVGWEQYQGETYDPRGNLIDSWADPVEIDGCGFDPGSSVEPRDGTSQRVITSPVCYIPKRYPIGERDKITARGKTYEVEGEPADWRHPMTGWDPDLLVVTLRKVTG